MENEEIVIRHNIFIQLLFVAMPTVILYGLITGTHDPKEVAESKIFLPILILACLSWLTKRTVLTKDGCYFWYGLTWQGRRINKIYQSRIRPWNEYFINYQYFGTCMARKVIVDIMGENRLMPKYMRLITKDYPMFCRFLYENGTGAEMDRDTWLYLLRVTKSKWPEYQPIIEEAKEIKLR
jgi:hypothetical protein